ncbi:MAG: uracil-DNA glycosylase [Caulobacterales bacterium]|nr:uracil-DNA glycosylase [Caulobacterales bacterium]
MTQVDEKIANLDSGQIVTFLLDWWRENGVEVLEAPRASAQQVQNPVVKSETPARPSAASIINPNNAVDEAKEIAKSANSLSELAEKLKNFENFHLVKTASQMVFCDGIESADIMVIGEAPGREEDEQGKPFVGQAGQLLDAMLGSIGLSRKTNFYLTNTINWRPPGNRTPTKDEIAISLPIIKKHIELKAPKFIILVGGVAASSLLNKSDGISKLRKATHKYILENGTEIPTYCIYHPAFLLRRPEHKQDTWRDLLAIKKVIAQMGLS